jgi:hypothetical protein
MVKKDSGGWRSRSLSCMIKGGSPEGQRPELGLQPVVVVAVAL